MERSRFRPNEYLIYKLTEVNWPRNYLMGNIVFDSVKGRTPPEQLERVHQRFLDWSAHYEFKNSAWLTYKLDKNHPYVLIYEPDEQKKEI